jgi:exopolysaccharide biosynthesis polyprenyl glycosylphosphotransferase
MAMPAESGTDDPSMPVAAAPPSWEASYATALIVLDAVAITVAAAIALRLRFGPAAFQQAVLWTSLVSAAFPPTWVVVMAANRAYEPRFLGRGSEEFRRVFRAAVGFIAVVASVCYAAQIQLARGYVAIALPLGTLLTLLGRYAARQVVHAQRARGRCTQRVLAVGDRHHVAELVGYVRRASHSGLNVVGACVPDAQEQVVRAPGGDVPVVGALTTVTAAVRQLRADAVAVTASPAVSAQTLRRLAWELEDCGVDLLVSPSLTDVAGPRISIQPVAGLPLLHVNQPEFSGGRKLLKAGLDRALAVATLLLLSPFLLLIGLLIRVDSPGPAIFRQRRVGQGGKVFTCLKFRSMGVSAEFERESLLDRNERSDGLLFKIRDDPRVTRAGRWLRKYSLDELPQLWNIARGDMSLVGPRPPLPSEAEQYGYDARRRLLVKPGLTGLWQISGRSDLPWDETVRLDLYYVENWSPALDVLIIWKTAFAVLGGSGAY